MTDERKTLWHMIVPTAPCATCCTPCCTTRNGATIRHMSLRAEIALLPGAFEVASAPRLKRPAPKKEDEKASDQSFGIPDNTLYENVEVPVLIIAGENDPLREPGYSKGLAAHPRQRTPRVENCGHCPNIEHADRFNKLAIDFLQRVHTR